MADLKLKALLEKIVGVIKNTNKIGTGAEIYGKNSAGTGDCNLNRTYKNPLKNQCYGRLYQIDGTATSATSSVQQNDLFIVTPSAGKIKVLETGRYLLYASAYAYSGFTAEDRFQLRIQINEANVGRFFARERMSSNYQIIYLNHAYKLQANDEVTMVVGNYEVTDPTTRGKVVTTANTMLQVVRVG